MLSASGEIIRAVAKGARKPKAKLGAASGLFRCNDWLLHTGRNLEIVTEARTIEAHSHLTAQYRTSLAASVIGEFIAKTHLPGQTDSRIYDMTMVALGLLDEIARDASADSSHPSAGESRADAIVLAYLLKSIAMHGYYPAADLCADCGRPVSCEAVTVEWSSLVAGVLCDECAPGAVDARRIPGAAALWLSFLLRSTLAEVALATVPTGALDDLFELTAGLVETHVQTRLRALEVYRSDRVAERSRNGLTPPS